MQVVVMNQAPKFDIQLNPNRIKTVYKEIQTGNLNVFANNKIALIRGGMLGIGASVGKAFGDLVLKKAKEFLEGPEKKPTNASEPVEKQSNSFQVRNE